jgi:hypothetical protein
MKIKIIMILLIFLVLSLFIFVLDLPPGIDWRDTYRPATLNLLHGQSPYTTEIFFAAPWSLLPLIPLSILPMEIGRAVLIVVSLFAYAYVSYSLGARGISFIAFLISPPVIINLLNGNIDWLPLVGFILPPKWGLFFVLIKPQIGIGVAVFWVIEAWRDGKMASVWRMCWPVTLTTIISFLVFGLWPLRFSGSLEIIREYNTSLWPASLPIGLGLMVAALRTRNIRFAMCASPCFSPVVLLHAWGGALVSLSKLRFELLAVVIGLWIQMIFGLWTLRIYF